VSARSRGAQGSGKTARTSAKAPKCPICGKPRSEEFRPFCSKHCADVDLGRWLGGRYVVPGAPVASNATEEDDEV
jgi:endogenous inhibitor of DNA gyrase (YacG/DUF329 family)